MAYAFDPHSFGQLLADAERQAAGARDHERQLNWLVTHLERDGGSRGHTLETVRQLCIEARAQRQLAENTLTRLVGPAAALDEVSHQTLVLVVDDSESSRETTAAILEEAGFSAMTATNGLEGVIVAHYARPSVILMDVTMPVLNGVEAARLIHSSALTSRLKILAYTAKPEAFEAPAVTRWFDDILQKPASPEAIIAAVQRFTPGRSTPSSYGQSGRLSTELGQNRKPEPS
jgi:CheY-like chemotaxis protein